MTPQLAALALALTFTGTSEGDKLIGDDAGASTVTIETDVTGPATITVTASDSYDGRADTWLDGGAQDEESVHVVIVHPDGSETHVATTPDLDDGVEHAARVDTYNIQLGPGDQVRLDHATTGGWDSLWVDATITPAEILVPAPEVDAPAPAADIETSSTVQTPDEPVVITPEPVTLPAEQPDVADPYQPPTELAYTGSVEIALLALGGALMTLAGWCLTRIGRNDAHGDIR